MLQSFQSYDESFQPQNGLIHLLNVGLDENCRNVNNAFFEKNCNKHLFVIENFAFELKVPLSTHNLQYYPNEFCHLNNALLLNRE